MNTSYFRFTLDLDIQDSQVYVTVRQGDTAKGIAVLLSESGTPYSIADGVTAVLAARKSDGSYIYASCTIENNCISAVLPASFTAATGKLTACIRLTESSAALTSPPFTIFVDAPAAPAQS